MSKTVTFSDLNNLKSQVKFVALKGSHSFQFSGFTKTDLDTLLTTSGCNEVLFFPIEDPVSSTPQQLLLLAVPAKVDATAVTLLSPAIYSECPPRCKDDDKHAVMASFEATLAPAVTLTTSI